MVNLHTTGRAARAAQLRGRARVSSFGVGKGEEDPRQAALGSEKGEEEHREGNPELPLTQPWG